MGSVSGSSAGSAKTRLAAAERVSLTPALTQALHEGELSSDHLKVVTSLAAEVPGASTELLALVKEGASHQELADAAARRRAAERSREDDKA